MEIRTLPATLVLVAVALLTPILAAAQPRDTTDFSGLARILRPGGTVVVTDRDGRRTKGRVLDLTGDAITLETRDEWVAQRRVFLRDDVTVIRRSDSVWNGALIGLGAGAVAAEVFVRQVCGPRGYDDECAAIATPVGWVSFVPGGALVGALIDRAIGNEAIYQQRRPVVSVAPLIGPSMGGVALAVRF